MYRTEQYEDIVASIKVAHIKDVWTVLSTHVGVDNAIHLDDLVTQVKRFGRLHGRWADRMVRLCIEHLRNRKVPIYSGREGYCLGLPHEMLEWAMSYRAGAQTKLRIADKLLDVVQGMVPAGEIQTKAKELQDEIQMTLNLNKGS